MRPCVVEGLTRQTQQQSEVTLSLPCLSERKGGERSRGSVMMQPVPFAQDAANKTVDAAKDGYLNLN